MIYDIMGYLGALLMGISLGAIGGGGSIFSVPILVYLFGVNPVIATGYSLFVVGTTSLSGSLSHIRNGNINWRAVFFFGIPSITSVFITRTLIVPNIPNPVFAETIFEVAKPRFFLLIFAFFMLAAAFAMTRKKKVKSDSDKGTNFLKLTSAGFFEGALTGLVGAGGGFLIIPILVLLGKVEMKKAIGSSLVIIAVKSLMGFMGDMHNDVRIEWNLLIPFTLVAIVGIIFGSAIANKMPNEKLKPLFGYFIFIMALIILFKELFLKYFIY
ncbi:MAG: sulfite exporter TauE/SafE family protein [Saprospiraceae bacterium]|nr:sulfite exporter TauE/SafE family protein [Saprospiraceae bacterium]